MNKEGKEMFKDDIFEKWLDTKSKQIILKLDKEKLSSEEMIVLVLKAQSNHFQHLDEDLRKDMKQLREDMNRRFEQVDKRFEQVDKRFDRLYTFMRWQTGLGFVALAGIYIKLFLG